jgi:hypothetical protein
MCLRWCAYGRMRKDAAVGVDGVTKEQYGQDLERNLQDLHERLRSKRYRHQPIRRVHIPKDKGRMRPIGISAFEDMNLIDFGQRLHFLIPALRRERSPGRSCFEGDPYDAQIRTAS